MSNIFQKAPPFYNYIVGLANSVDFESTPVTQSGVAVTQPLQDIVIPGNAFLNDGQKAVVIGYGVQTTVGTLSQLGIALNGASIGTHNTTVDGVSRGWRMEIELIRRNVDLLIFMNSQLNILI